MWQSVLTCLILENLETLRHYQTSKGTYRNAVESILQYVSDIIMTLPWYFRIPVIVLSNTIGLLCLLTTGHRIDFLSSEQRSLFLRRVRFIPFFGMLHKLVRSMVFLKLFDILPLKVDYVSSANPESN